MAKLTHVNINLSDVVNNAQSLARVFLHMKNLMVQAGWEVVGSSDGYIRWACRGETPALPPEHQGSGGDHDCWLDSETFSPQASPVPGSVWAARAWVVLQEPGEGRQWVFQQSGGITTIGATYWGYGYVGYNREGDLDLSGASLKNCPTSGTTRNIVGSPNSNGDSLIYNVSLSAAHLFAHDDPQNGAYAWGWAMIQDSGALRHVTAQCTLAPDSPHLDHDGDPICVLYTTSSTLSQSSTYRYLNYGLPSQSWGTTTWGATNYWAGGGPLDPRDGLDRIARPLIYQGSGSSEQYVGAIDRGMRWSARPLAYPMLARDQHGQNWVWLSGGVMWPWEDGEDPPPPL